MLVGFDAHVSLKPLRSYLWKSTEKLTHAFGYDDTVWFETRQIHTEASLVIEAFFSNFVALKLLK